MERDVRSMDFGTVGHPDACTGKYDAKELKFGESRNNSISECGEDTKTSPMI
jgi:hypothetical protein